MNVSIIPNVPVRVQPRKNIEQVGKPILDTNNDEFVEIDREVK